MGMTDDRLLLPCECGVCVVSWSYYAEAIGSDWHFEVDVGTIYLPHPKRLRRTRLRDAWRIIRAKEPVYGEGVVLSAKSARRLALYIMANLPQPGILEKPCNDSSAEGDFAYVCTREEIRPDGPGWEGGADE